MKSERNQAQASKNPLPVESQRVYLVPPAAGYDNMGECCLRAKLIEGFYLRLVT